MTARRTELEVAGEVVVRLVGTLLIPGTPQAIRRAADALGIPVDTIRQAHEHLERRSFQPLRGEPCRLQSLPQPPPDVRQRRRKTKAAPGGPFVCGIGGCLDAYPSPQGRASHRVAAHAEPIDCPKGCGRKINPRGVGPHTAHCAGVIV